MKQINRYKEYITGLESVSNNKIPISFITKDIDETIYFYIEMMKQAKNIVVINYGNIEDQIGKSELYDIFSNAISNCLERGADIYLIGEDKTNNEFSSSEHLHRMSPITLWRILLHNDSNVFTNFIKCALSLGYDNSSVCKSISCADTSIYRIEDKNHPEIGVASFNAGRIFKDVIIRLTNSINDEKNNT
jgi:hypothetical protein